MAWNIVPKAQDTDYSTSNPSGREFYDDTSISYDSSTSYYDGIDPFQWTDVPKPVNLSSVVVGGFATGLIMPPTRAASFVSGGDRWIYVDKPID